MGLHLEDHAAFVIRELAKFRKRDEIILDLCEQSGCNWDEAATFLRSVERQEAHQIRIRQRPLLTSISIVMILGGLGLIVVTGWPKIVASLWWPSTHGVVISSEVSKTWTYEGDPAWSPHVVFRYSINQHYYTSEKVDMASGVGNGSTPDFARQVVNRYPAGARVEVYYAPDNPATAVLEPGIPDNDPFICALVLGGGGFGLFLALMNLLYSIRENTRQ